MKKFAFIVFALSLCSAFTSVKAADSCPGAFLTNGSGSPPVVTGTTAGVLAWGPSPSFYLYVDGGAIYLPDPNPYNPPGAYFSTFVSVGLAYGSHSMWAQWDPCVVNFSNVAPSQRVDYVNVTAGGSGPSWGFEAGIMGSVSPTALTGGATYKAIADTYNWYTGMQTSQFFACGFTGDPGQAWLTSVAVGSTTKLSSAATIYSYQSGCAYWHWNGYLGIAYSGVTQAVVTHY